MWIAGRMFASLRWRWAPHSGQATAMAKWELLWTMSSLSKPSTRRSARKYGGIYSYIYIYTHDRRKASTLRCNRDCSCEQKYKWHRLLSYDPNNDCSGIFMDWFLFPSCCTCRYVYSLFSFILFIILGIFFRCNKNPFLTWTVNTSFNVSSSQSESSWKVISSV